MNDDALSTAEIKKRSLSGAKWLILTNAMGMPAAYAITVLLGRTGPAALGSYALVQIFLSVVTTFVMFGGPTVLRNFLPKIQGASARGQFLYTYGLLTLGLLLLFLVLFFCFPSFLAYFLQQEIGRRQLGGFALLAAAVISSECLMGAADGLMHIKLAALARLMTRVILLPLLAGLFIFNREFLDAHAMGTILVGSFVAYAAGSALCIRTIVHDPRFQMKSAWYLPEGFGAFTLTTSAAMVFSFLYGNFDRMIVLSVSDLEGLGKYQAVLSLALIVEYIPKMIGTALVPMFSSLLASGGKVPIQNAYVRIQHVGATVMSVLAIGVTAFSAELLSFTGYGYATYDYILGMFCAQSVLTSLFLGNTAILTSYEKNAFRIGTSCFQITLQITLTLLYIDRYGILAIAGAKVIAVILAQYTSIFYVVYVLREGFRIPRAYWAGAAVAVTIFFRTTLLPPGWWVSLWTCTAALAVFWLLAGLTVAECRDIFLTVIPGGKLVARLPKIFGGDGNGKD